MTANLTTAALVCRSRHPLEWLARTPRTTACTDCTHVVGLVVDALYGRPAL
ncbi:MAG: hypothetical protein JWP74_1740 [Marmoricola sp.]|nr:hypothetical protein [Marmoricola sp.]